MTSLPIIRGPATSPLCSECPFSTDGRPTQPVPGIGPADPLFIVLGEGPGAHERQTGFPFVGASGKLLDRVLRSTSVEREQVWIANALLCTPPSASDTDKRKARACCAPRLEVELATMPRKPVFALGAIAAQRLLGDKFSIKQMAGACFDTDDGRVVIPSLHPAHILRGVGDAKDTGSAHTMDLAVWNLLFDCGKVARVAEGKLVRFTDDVEVEVSDSKRASSLVLDMLSECEREGVLVNDLETNSLRPTKAQIKAIGLGTPKRTVSVVWSLVDERAREAFRAALLSPHIHKWWHNHLYDVPVLRHNGYRVAGPVGDTMILHHNAFPGLAHDLQRVATQFFAISPWKAEFRGGGKAWEVDFALADSDEKIQKALNRILELCRYCAKDTLSTARLIDPLQQAVDRTNSRRTYDTDMEMAAIAEEMVANGLPLNEDRNQKFQVYFKHRIAQSQALIEGKANDPEIQERLLDYLAMELSKGPPRKGTGKKDGRNRNNRAPDPEGFLDRHAIRFLELKDQVARGKWSWKINAPMHVAAYLRARRVPLFKETKGGRLSVGQDILDKLAYLPEVSALLNYREDQKSYSTFVLKYAKANEGGRLHSSVSVIKITGRWSTNDVQTMNVSKGSPTWWCQCRHPSKLHVDKKGHCGSQDCSCVAYKPEKKTFDNWLYKWWDADRGEPVLEHLDNAGMPNLRWQIVAEPDYDLVGFDFSQLEGRIIGLLSGDEILLKVFANPPTKYGPGDIHSTFARLVWKDYDDVPEAKRDKLRDFIKRTGYGALYGGSVDTLWHNLLRDDPKVLRQDVARVVLTIQRDLRGVSAWHEWLLRQVLQPPHELRSLDGRRRCFPLGQGTPTDIYNFTVQSSGADIMARGMRKMRPHFDNTRLIIGQFHDACAFMVPKVESKVFCEKVEECFHQKIEYRGKVVDFPIEAKIGNDWAQV